jgi:hypothetical protein
MRKVLLTISTLLYSISSFACSCLSFNLERAVNESESVYFAQAVSARIVLEKNSNGRAHIEAIMKIDEVLKGQVVSGTTKITTGLGGGDCGVPISIPTTYIVFTSKSSNSVSICNGTKPVNHIVHFEDYNELSESIKKIINTKPKSKY